MIFIYNKGYINAAGGIDMSMKFANGHLTITDTYPTRG
jgi:hypothetical protein